MCPLDGQQDEHLKRHQPWPQFRLPHPPRPSAEQPHHKRTTSLSSPWRNVAHFKVFILMNAVIVVFPTAVLTVSIYCATPVQNLFVSITCLKQLAVLHYKDDVDCLIDPCVVTRRKRWTDTQPWLHSGPGGGISPSLMTSDPFPDVHRDSPLCLKGPSLPSSCYIIAAAPQAAAVPIHI